MDQQNIVLSAQEHLPIGLPIILPATLPRVIDETLMTNILRVKGTKVRYQRNKRFEQLSLEQLTLITPPLLASPARAPPPVSKNFPRRPLNKLVDGLF